MKPRAAGASDVGRVRDHNEDAFAIIDAEHLYAVADGMGGHESGEVASRMAVDVLRDYFELTAPRAETPPLTSDAASVQAANRLLSGIRLANRNIYEVGRRDRKTMGTTIVAAHLAGSTFHIAHVGDSRAYLIRAGAITRLTRDHSALEEFRDIKPGLTEEDARNFPYHNVITRALGTLPVVQVDVGTLVVGAGDLVLLCCDGLSNMVAELTMLDIVMRARTLEEATQTLVTAANEGGGDDNITAVLVLCEADG